MTLQGPRLEDVTDIAAYKSNNEKIAIVNANGFVTTVGLGSTNITVSYTAVPGSANLIAALVRGKVPMTFTVDVPVTVRAGEPPNFP